MKFWVGPWVWDTTGLVPTYRPPTDTVHALDLRSLSHQGTPNSTNGNGLFIMPDAAAPGADYVEVPANFQPSSRNAVRNKLQLPQVIISPGRRLFVLELLTRHAVVDGSTFGRPLMPGRDGRIKLALDEAVENHPIDTSSQYWAKIQEALHAQYRDYRTRAGLTLPEDFHRKWLSVMLEKFAGRITDYHEFIPSDLPDESPLPHSTTITDNFNRADNASPGSSSEGWSWTEVTGDAAISSNQIKDTEATGTVNTALRAETDLAGDDHYSQIQKSSGFGDGSNNSLYALTRFAAAAQTFYLFGWNNDGSEHKYFKCVTGTFTELTHTGSTTDANSQTIKLEVDGSNLTGYVNAAAESGVTDSAITGNTRTGIMIYSAIDNGFADNWEAGDLAAGSTLVKDLIMSGLIAFAR